ncbi:MAG: HEPN domain-containing protein [Bacteroidota bacterium]
MANRYLDWMKQAYEDLNHARHSIEFKDFDWSCFAAHQSAEKALKALYLKLGMEAWGHSLIALLGNLPETIRIPEELGDYARTLDKYYIPTRYPNGFDEGAPVDYYTKSEAEQGVKYADKLIQFCESLINKT